MTHDSIGLGEDGPTHQPVEHLAALRAIPNLWCSARPTRSRPRSAGSWRWRRPRPPVDPGAVAPEPAGGAHRTRRARTSAANGAYELAAADGEAKVTIFATGTEVEIALAAARPAAGRRASPTRVVSMPCCELFEQQSRRLPASRHRQRAGQGRRRSRRSAWAGTASSASDGAFIGMTRLRRQRARPRSSTSISASPPKPRSQAAEARLI